jgi:hypothetical protein
MKPTHEAVFVGSDGSLGLTSGRVYHLTVIREHVIVHLDGGGTVRSIPYTVGGFLANWTNVTPPETDPYMLTRSGPDRVTTKQVQELVDSVKPVSLVLEEDVDGEQLVTLVAVDGFLTPGGDRHGYPIVWLPGLDWNLFCTRVRTVASDTAKYFGKREEGAK